VLGPVIEGRATESDALYLRRAIAMAERSRNTGQRPFGALVVLHGEVLAEAASIRPAGRDATAHSELRVVSAAAQKHPPQELADAVLYASAEPCAMCAGAVYWSGIGKVVFGLSEATLRRLTGDHPSNPTLTLPCREVFARGQRRIEVVGPGLEDEAIVAHQGYWTRR
jgi:tRNA(Arg) A34 adenosine deaminase TadA